MQLLSPLLAFTLTLHKCYKARKKDWSSFHPGFGSRDASKRCRAKTRVHLEAEFRHWGKLMTHAAVKRCGDSCATALAAQLQPQGQGRCSMFCLAMAAGMPPSSPWRAFLTCCPASLSRQLSEENANLQEYVEKEVEEKKKLSRTNEELLWKLQEGDAVSPVKLPPAPSTPFYRCSSGNSSPAKVRTLRR